MENYAVTFNYYDKKGRRLSVFCRLLNPTEAELFVLTCSKQDKFNKKYAHTVYKEYLINPEGEIIKKHKPIILKTEVFPECGELKTLINYCRENYYANFTALVEQDILLKCSDTESFFNYK